MNLVLGWVAYLPSGRPGEDGRQWREVELAEGETREVDFGRATALAAWRGTARLPGGAVLPGPKWVTVRSDAGVEQSFQIDAEGRFEVRLAAGAYAVSTWGWGGEYELVSVTIGALDAQRDLIFPGARLSGRIAYDGTWHRPEEPPRRVQVWLAPAGGEPSLATQRIDEVYAFFPVEPGEYELSVHPNGLLGATDGRLAVTVPEGRNEVLFDITITDP